MPEVGLRVYLYNISVARNETLSRMTRPDNESRRSIISLLLQSTIGDWLETLGLIFGGCCSNALALELVTKQNPHAGTFITFAQFLFVSVYALPKNIVLKPDTNLYSGLVLDRNELLRRIAAEIIHKHDTKGHSKRLFFVAIAGCMLNSKTESHGFAIELAKELNVASPELTVKQVLPATKVDSVLLASKMSDRAEKTVVVVYEEEPLPISAPIIAKWDYYIVLASDLPSAQGKRDWQFLDPSLVVDVTSPPEPAVIYYALPSSRPNWLKLLTRIRLKKRRIPLSRWVIQVALFFITSLLNNAAFGYNIPMSVHIIFRSGGLIVNMLMGWFIDGRRYNIVQVASIIMVTLGVVCTTLSASNPPRASTSPASSTGSYAAGIALLTLALIMSGLMGLEQDRVYAKYGRGHWQEATFYLHFLALPGFGFVWRDLIDQVKTVNASTRTEISLGTLMAPWTAVLSTEYAPKFVPYFLRSILKPTIVIPSFYFPLVLNITTQLICVSGVNRLTSRVNSLTVTLVLVVRKAASLAISVLWLGKGNERGGMLWTGAALVLFGTIGYTTGSGSSSSSSRKKWDVREQKIESGKKEN